MAKKKILLLSGYDAVSHRHWRNVLVDGLQQYDWTVIALPDRHFYWRARGNSLTYAFSHRQLLSVEYDLIIATSMVDICNLRGFLPHLGAVPTIVYFHENQFAYPLQQPGSNIINAQLTSIYSALCGDRIVFNSQFNLDSFFSGADTLLNKMPDGVEKDLLKPAVGKSSVLPVPLLSVDPGDDRKQADTVASIPRPRPVEIVWNHRWEYDKQPEVLFAAMQKIKHAGVDFRLHVMGQSFRQVPECFDAARVSFKDEIATWGHQPDAIYYQVLRQADIVISTALHDFQGLSLLEAIYCGCLPVVPDRVAYPEYIPPSLRYPLDQDEAQSLADSLLSVLQSDHAIPDVSRFLSTNLLAEYEALIDGVI